MSTIPCVFNNAEWSFFHWEDKEDVKDRPSDVTITTRTNDCYTMLKITLPKRIAVNLEKELEKEKEKEMISKYLKVNNKKEIKKNKNKL
jgi:hypothetical protein